MKTYQEAESYCKSYNTNLFAITGSKINVIFRDYMTNKFGSGTGGKLWINGIQDSDDGWYVYNPSKNELFEGVSPSNTFVAGSNCLIYENPISIFTTRNNDCSDPNHFYCELFRT
jgi:hypothetical protein